MQHHTLSASAGVGVSADGGACGVVPTSTIVAEPLDCLVPGTKPARALILLSEGGVAAWWSSFGELVTQWTAAQAQASKPSDCAVFTRRMTTSRYHYQPPPLPSGRRLKQADEGNGPNSPAAPYLLAFMVTFQLCLQRNDFVSCSGHPFTHAFTGHDRDCKRSRRADGPDRCRSG